MHAEIESRVDRIEDYMAQLAYQQIKTEMSLRLLSDEMKEFKDEMKEFKQEMKEFKNEARQEHKQMNRQWGNLANKLGTIVEDIIAPAIRPVLKKYFGADIDYLALNVRKQDKSIELKGEFDVIACDSDRVYLVEVKSTPKSDYLDAFLENMKKFSRLFPEFGEKQLIPIFASLRIEDELTDLASENNVYTMAYREWEYMDILNFSGVSREKLCLLKTFG